ncbi:isovaleryl-CoA dehydrogenase, partial [Trypanosoma cruzi]
MFLGRRVLLPRLGGVPNGAIAARPFASSANSSMDFLFNPTPEHKMLRNTIAKFAAERIEPQARQNDIEMRFNTELMRELGDLGVLGVTVSDEDGGAGMDATASVIVHHEISKCDPGFCLA